MQGDLISRKELIEMLTKYKFGAIKDDVAREYIKETVLRFVSTMPTAYSVENVVAELEELSLSYELNCDHMIRENKCQESADCGMCAFKQAIEIVRNGGKE